MVYAVLFYLLDKIVMANESITVIDTLNIQAKQLLEWKTKLNSDCFADLYSYIVQENKKITIDSDPYSVLRGNDLYQFIANWYPSKYKNHNNINTI